MFAIVEAEMSTRLSAPRCSRSGDSGALVSENGTDAASLMVSLPGVFARPARLSSWQALSGFRELTEFGVHGASLRDRETRPPVVSRRWSAPCGRPRPGAVAQHDLAVDGNHPRLWRVVAQDQPGDGLAELLERQPHRGQRRVDVAQGG